MGHRVYQKRLGLNWSEFLIADDVELINKVRFAELFTGLELIGNSSPYAREQSYYWHREARSSNSEVDYVIQKNEEIIPVEVKSGSSGQLQSIRSSTEERGLAKEVCVSHNNSHRLGHICYMPVYMAGRIVR